MKVAFFESNKWEVKISKKNYQKYLKNNLEKHKLIFFNESIEKEVKSKNKEIEAIVVFYSSKIDKNIIDNLPNLKLITTMSTGFDHIDVNYCNQKKIKICNIPKYGSNVVAEHTFALILSLSRKIYDSIKRTRENHSFKSDERLMGFELKGKILGLIGYGSIGQNVSKIANGFGMKTIVYDIKKNEKLAEKNNIKYVSFEELIKKSDIISLHAPYNESTHHILNTSIFEKMKKGVYIINTARGGLIDTFALVSAIKNKIVKGAALDVLEEESDFKEEIEILDKIELCNEKCRILLEDLILMKMDNVIITPHNAYNSVESKERILNTTIENINSFNKNKIKNCIN
ncbi:MAG: NAD(P)-dependent oxidoreductase [Nanoarchaeota archaeon]